MIGIDPNTGLAYEGLSNYGHGLWPAPLMMRATFVLGPGDWEKLPTSGALREAQCVFREDYFDPVTRIRRGRFYDTGGIRTQPDFWWVHKHPVLPEETGQLNPQGQVQKLLLNFTPMYGIGQRFSDARDLMVVLGAQPAVTAWSLVAVERVGNDEDVVTLRARANFGYLPDLMEAVIPEAARERVKAAVAKVVDAAHRQSGIALVDLCRDALTVVLSEYLISQGRPDDLRAKELGKLVEAMAERADLQRSAANIIRLLHPRGKSNEQVRNATRQVTEADGAFALEAFAFLLRDLGWAR